MFENTVDIAHFATVHGVSGFGDLDLETDGHWLKAVAEVTFQTPRGPVSGAVDSELYGMGIDVVRHRGLGRSCTLLTVTPIDGEFVDARYTFFVLTDAETGEMSRMGLGFARDFCKQIEQDIPIWESKIYRDRPQLARGEGAITEFRSWARQSYEESQRMRSLSYDQLFIGGRWQAPATGQRITVISPHTEEPIGETPEATPRTSTGPSRRAKGVRRRSVAATRGVGADGEDREARRRLHRARRRDGRPHHRGDGLAAQFQQAGTGNRGRVADVPEPGDRQGIRMGRAASGHCSARCRCAAPPSASSARSCRGTSRRC